LVHHVLKHEYDGNMHEVHVYEFLVEKGISPHQDYDADKKLPHEIRNYTNLVNVDEMGYVTLE
ncbi:hypothetical protein, partial [Pseudomonas sp. 2995-1]|uniref:hypothetical protein n=1 Tax=Pseudomonas sp. 2995-1 TaxID=1712679 RepID=UPI000C4C5E17